LAESSQQIDRPFIFVSHCPSYDTPLDVINSGAHVGSLSIRRFIEHWSDRSMPLASLHGHIHESPRRSGSIMTQVNTALSINPGQSTTLQYLLLELTHDTDPPNIGILYSQF
jgi:Icc-related predicted phosphoesterase